MSFYLKRVAGRQHIGGSCFVILSHNGCLHLEYSDCLTLIWLLIFKNLSFSYLFAISCFCPPPFFAIVWHNWIFFMILFYFHGWLIHYYSLFYFIDCFRAGTVHLSLWQTAITWIKHFMYKNVIVTTFVFLWSLCYHCYAL